MHLLFVISYGMLDVPHFAARHCTKRQAVGALPKGGELMRFTFTFYVGRKTVTISIVVKSKNRHSAK